jgi:hypothetical protein
MPGSSKDLWHEPESEWHILKKLYLVKNVIDWKGQGGYMEHRVEKNINKFNTFHVADVWISGFVIEVQHSRLDYVSVLAREQFYENMCWVLDSGLKLEIKKTKTEGIYKIHKIAEGWRNASKHVLFENCALIYHSPRSSEWFSPEGEEMYGDYYVKEKDRSGSFWAERQWDWKGSTYVKGAFLEDIFKEKSLPESTWEHLQISDYLHDDVYHLRN